MRMILLEQYIIILIGVVSNLLAYGQDNKESDLLQRHKRSASCSSVESLKKYLYTSGHTACLSPLGSADLTKVGVSDQEKAEIVNKHNEYRATTPATDMTKMSWDDEAAYLAQKWSENCQQYHDSGFNRRIPGRLSLGQNLAWASTKITWTAIIKMWYDEIKDFTYNGVNDFNKVGHYTQVVWAKSIKIGCGYTYCAGSNRHMFACNYGPAGNLNINKPYSQGNKCADCPQNCENGLCNCNKVCLNGGTLNLLTCTCNCVTGYSGPDCVLDCAAKTDPRYCVNQYTPENCPRFTNVPSECPHMCQFCPNGGIAVTGPTDNKGTLVTFDPTGTIKPSTESSITSTGGGRTTIGETSKGNRNSMAQSIIVFSLFLLISQKVSLYTHF